VRTLSEKIRLLRGGRSVLAFSRLTGVRRKTLSDAENGQRVWLASLKKIAKATKVGQREWADLLTCWVCRELGDQADLVQVKSALHVDHLIPRGSQADVGGLLSNLFAMHANENQCEILKALARPEVLQGIGALNRIWEASSNASTPSRPKLAITAETMAEVLAKHGGRCYLSGKRLVADTKVNQPEPATPPKASARKPRTRKHHVRELSH
jgi:transcriptional regulator with XRE-family HTH domain